MQLQHAIRLDVNQSRFSCQSKITADLSCFYLINKTLIVQINYLLFDNLETLQSEVKLSETNSIGLTRFYCTCRAPILQN